MKRVKYAVDRIEGTVIVLENINTKEIKEISIKDINFKSNERDILIYKDNKYFKDEKIKEDRINMLREKLNKVKNI